MYVEASENMADNNSTSSLFCESLRNGDFVLQADRRHRSHSVGLFTPLLLDENEKQD